MDSELSGLDWQDVPRRPCPVGATLDLIGDRWSLLIIRDVMNGVYRFDDLVERLGISRATLSDRLRKLVDAQILTPTDYEDGRGRRRIEYRLTEAGWNLQYVFVALREWGDTHLIGAGNEPLRFVDRDTGRDVRLALVDAESSELVDPKRTGLVPGPGFTTVAGSSGVSRR